MLIIRRRVGESILLGGDIEIQVTEITGNRVKIAIAAPRELPILRKEIRIAADQNLAAARLHDSSALTSVLERFRSGN